MKAVAFLAAALVLSLSAVYAGDAASSDSSSPSDWSDSSAQSNQPDVTTPAPSNIKTSYEFDAEAAYVGAARTNFGEGVKGNVSEQESNGKFVIAPQYNDGPIYRFGLAYQRYNFGLSKAAPIPDILQSENVIVGMDFSLFNSWLVRVEADPGLYNDGRATGFRDFNVPFSIGGSYIAGEDLQWVLGLEVDINRQFPVIPAVGARWAINDQWVIDAVLPTPRIEYDWSKDLTLYVGGNFDDGTYRVDHGLGAALGRPHLGGAVVEYDEVRLGAGISWKAFKALTLEFEGGYLPYREFDFHRADMHFSNDDGAAYGQMTINAQF